MFAGDSRHSDLRKDNVVYAAISKELLHSGQHMKLTLAGEPYANKPPLFFWITAGSMHLLGESVFAARLPTALAACACLLLIFSMARHWRDEQTGYWAVLLATLTYRVLRTASGCRMESLFVFCLLGTLWQLGSWEEDQRKRHILWAGLCTGAGLLTKGPMALLPWGVYIIWWIWKGRKQPIPGRALLIAGSLATAALVASTYFVWAAQQPRLFEVMFGQQMLERVANGSTQSFDSTPAWSYIFSYLRSTFWYLPFLLIGWWQLRREHQQDTLWQLTLILCSAILILVLIPSAKYDRYLLPIYYIGAIWAAAGLPLKWKAHGQKALILAGGTVAVVIAVLPGNWHRHDYGVLETVNDMAVTSTYPIVPSPEFRADWESKAAMVFYLNCWLGKPPAQGPWIDLQRNPIGEQKPLLKSPSVSVYLRNQP